MAFTSSSFLWANPLSAIAVCFTCSWPGKKCLLNLLAVWRKGQVAAMLRAHSLFQVGTGAWSLSMPWWLTVMQSHDSQWILQSKHKSVKGLRDSVRVSFSFFGIVSSAHCNLTNAGLTFRLQVIWHFSWFQDYRSYKYCLYLILV